MKVLLYSQPFAPMVGGQETLVMSLAMGLANLPGAGRLARAEVTLVTRAARGGFDDGSLPFRVVRRPSLRALVRLIRAADVVHLAGPVFVPLLLGLLLGKPVVVEHSLYQVVCPNGLLLDERTQRVCPGHFLAGHYGECWRCNAVKEGRAKSLAMLLLSFPRRWMCARAAQNIAPTFHVARRVALPRTATLYHGVPPAPNGRRAGERFASPLSFGYVGRLVSKKGLEVLLAAAGQLAAEGGDFRLKLIGDGPERERLRQRADALGLNGRVAFTGFLTGAELERALESVAVVVMPSIWEEVAGLAAMEHMMRGRAVIASDIGGLGELVSDAGLKFLPGDAARLAACMQRLVKEPGLAVALGETAGRRAQALFREDRMAAEHLALYAGLLEQPAAVPREVWGER